MKYYLAGKMTGLPEYNYPLFREVARALRATGLEVVSPHEINAGEEFLPDGVDHRLRCMRKNLHALIDCDGIILLEGWETSRGACDEFEVARRLGLEIKFWRELP